jgi:hypothetical protein
MTNEQYYDWCKSHDACEEALADIAERKQTLAERWVTNERGDWMIWLCIKAGVSGSILRHISVDCARRALHLVREEYRATLAHTLDVAERYADGSATQDELAAASVAASAAAWAAASVAASAAAWAAASVAASAAAWAAWAVRDAAKAAELKAQADVVRRYVTPKIIKELIKGAKAEE